jgi:uncharacterized membrane protein
VWRHTLVLILLAISTITLIGGFMLKGQCLAPWEEGRQYGTLCYNDIQPLYSVRGIQGGAFPYVEGSLEGEGGLSEGAIEYPVLTGLFMWFVGTFVSNDPNAYLKASAIALAPFGLLTTFWLARRGGLRALMWAAAPAVVLYAFHNWDLLVVAAAVAGFVLWFNGRYTWSAVLFGIGGALKIYPLFFLGPLFLERWTAADRKGAVRAILAGLATFVVINLPFALINFDGWWATYEFHQMRGPNYDSFWQLRFPQLAPDDVNKISGVLTLGTFAAVLVVGLFRKRSEGRYPFVQACAALLAAFLLWNKVHSPQYTLWLLPFFVLLSISVVWWVAYSAVDLLVYVGIFRYLYEVFHRHVAEDQAFAAMKWGVYLRAVLLAALVVIFVLSDRADEPDAEEAEEVLSHPPSKVEAVGESAPA